MVRILGPVRMKALFGPIFEPDPFGAGENIALKDEINIRDHVITRNNRRLRKVSGNLVIFTETESTHLCKRNLKNIFSMKRTNSF